MKSCGEYSPQEYDDAFPGFRTSVGTWQNSRRRERAAGGWRNLASAKASSCLSRFLDEPVIARHPIR